MPTRRVVVMTIHERREQQRQSRRQKQALKLGLKLIKTLEDGLDPQGNCRYCEPLRADHERLRERIKQLEMDVAFLKERQAEIIEQFIGKTGDVPKLHPGCFPGCSCWL